MYNRFVRLTQNANPAAALNDDYIVIAPAGSVEIPLDLLNIKKVRLLVSQKWLDGTSATTGLVMSIRSGIGPGNVYSDAANKFATLDPTVIDQPSLAQPPVSAGPDTTEYNTVMTLLEDHYGRFNKLVFENLDAVNAVSLLLWGDLN